MANNNNQHIEIYNKATNYNTQCEVCGAVRSDVHHIEYRSSFGSKRKDEQDSIDNLIGLCRRCHELAHSPKTDKYHLSKEYLKEIVSER